jgi:ankyrin repeat protein
MATSGYTPLLIAAEEGQAAVVTALLEAKADPEKGMTDANTVPLYRAARFGHLAAVKALLRGGVGDVMFR